MVWRSRRHASTQTFPEYPPPGFQGAKVFWFKLWSFRLKLFRPDVKSIRPMTNSTLQHRLSEMFLVKLGFCCCRAVWTTLSISITTFEILKLTARKNWSLHVLDQRSLLYVDLWCIFCEKFSLEKVVGTVNHSRLFIFPRLKNRQNDLCYLFILKRHLRRQQNVKNIVRNVQDKDNKSTSSMNSDMQTLGSFPFFGRDFLTLWI